MGRLVAAAKTRSRVHTCKTDTILWTELFMWGSCSNDLGLAGLLGAFPVDILFKIPLAETQAVAATCG